MKTYLLNKCYKLRISGSSYNIIKNDRIVKYLDGAYGHKKCIKDAVEWVNKQ